MNVSEDYTAGFWRIGDAGHTVFGPKTDAPAPKIVAANLRRGDARLIAAAPVMVALLRRYVRNATEPATDRELLQTFKDARALLATLPEEPR